MVLKVHEVIIDDETGNGVVTEYPTLIIVGGTLLIRKEFKFTKGSGSTIKSIDSSVYSPQIVSESVEEIEAQIKGMQQ